MDPDYFKSYDMCWGTLGTVRPFSNFHPDRDVTEIQAALEKKDAVTLVRILTNRSNAQRQVIASTFEEITHKDLAGGLKKALSGDLEVLLLDLLMPPLQYEAQRLQQAMSGIGTDEETLMEILCTRSGKQLQEISATYKQLYKKDLEKEMKGETSGDFAKLVMALLNKENVVGGVQRDIESLSASLNGKKADAGPWIDILTSRDSDHLNKVLMGLELESGQMVVEAVEKKFSGDIRLGLKVLVQCIQSPDVYLAKRITTMKTPIVQGIMVSHSEEDLLCIRAAYIKLTGTSLYTALQKHFKGDHLQALLAICRSED
ncbi:annexin A2-like [Seriola lalandi dorsalis]|uniref:Annexin n=1 Tax=Seriola lalandi dorsalis TaxID=1841481 RepID=A0A3B4YKD7_SERLL|nr:annexin A2-like [Seriola lalandi dorsalis]XP_023284779.1 annexin A2-like [Seriola lalandi dorsalis]